MASICIQGCINDYNTPIPIRATYTNLYKWPESDAEFVRRHHHNHHHYPRVVDSVSCRQIYLRSYTFSRKESVQEKTKKCFGRVMKRRGVYLKKKPCVVIRRVKEVSCDLLISIFKRLLFCTTKVDAD